MKKGIIFFIIIVFPVMIFSQEYLSGLSSNPVIKSYLKSTGKAFQNKSYVEYYESLTLPFNDDFSNISIYPDTAKWINDEVYINADFAVYPVNYGVATFDVLDANGDIYPEASPFSFIADRLISYPIRLDSIISEGYEITPADSIYLSFYYQPQGRGDYPMSYDSLVIDFGLYNGDTIFSHIDYFWFYVNTLLNNF